ncbi:hypothetical protein PTSG_06078 [Salpingoeca rosetta]|uniref:PiggyBac transposable element-derived protein domain-containing protein n=1 Tax=Salpingoeca rosetta (strain ATCC 50818 / BSB-021) TaxID=946362 RepID=F2UDM2_SALR5|nr:uncharacterized protein PTSG_06078 [Salpingoeca rosetta]EGD74717.1 hypothetical protein PTSG_06078 [Salpingoeca rosetta]|eukprot:XP_004992974.1 hypothetical protein PTSG_06078 [Salpingoeca rosetta]
MSSRKRAKQLGVGARVVASAVAAFGVARACEAFGPGAHTRLVKGTIKEQTGRGRGRRWRVVWSTGSASTVPTRSLELDTGQAAAHGTGTQHGTGAGLTPAQAAIQPAQADTQALEPAEAIEVPEPSNQPAQHPPHSGSPQQSRAHTHAHEPDEAEEPAAVLVQHVWWKPARAASSLQHVRRPTPSFSPPTPALTLRPDNLLGFFLAAFPSTFLDALVSATSANLAAKGQRVTTTGEMLRVFGAFVGVAHLGLPLHQCWDDSYRDSDTFACLRFEQTFGLSRSRFEAILSCLAVVPDAPGDDPAQHQHQHQGQRLRPNLAAVEPAIAMFNASRREFRAGGTLVLHAHTSDTCASMDGVAHGCSAERGAEMELRSLADGESGVVLWLDVSDFEDGAAGDEGDGSNPAASNCAWMLDAAEAYAGSGRMLVGGPAVASVQAAYELKRRGLQFIGNVETMTRHFPKEWLAHHTPAPMGSTFTATADVDLSSIVHSGSAAISPVYIIAHAWRAARGVMTFVSTRSPDATQHRHDNSDDAITQSPIAHLYCSSRRKAAMHGVLSQGARLLAEAFTTNAPARHLLITLVGICITDAYLMLCHRWGEEHTPFWRFRLLLAKDLATNTADKPTSAPAPSGVQPQRRQRQQQQPRRQRQQHQQQPHPQPQHDRHQAPLRDQGQQQQAQSVAPATAASSSRNAPLSVHLPMLLRLHPYYADGHAKDTRLRCCICGKKTGYCCRECSQGTALSTIVPVCLPTLASSCFDAHLHSSLT